MKEIICSKEIELLQDKYVVYLKEVPVKIEPGGNAVKKAVKAYIRKVKS